jgi:hypothetical protein
VAGDEPLPDVQREAECQGKERCPEQAGRIPFRVDVAQPRKSQGQEARRATDPLPADLVEKALPLVETPRAVLAALLLPLPFRVAEDAILVSRRRRFSGAEKIHILFILKWGGGKKQPGTPGGPPTPSPHEYGAAPRVITYGNGDASGGACVGQRAASGQDGPGLDDHRRGPPAIVGASFFLVLLLLPGSMMKERTERIAENLAP